MKVRIGFVSNSSTSSFVIERVEGITDNIPFEDLKKAVLSCFKLKKNPDDIRIYDLSTKELIDFAIEKEKSFLKGWNDTLNDKLESYEKVKNILKDYGRVDFDVDEHVYMQQHKKLETPIIQTLNIIRKNMGIKSMIETVESGYGSILICMEENVIWGADGIKDSKKFGYHTEEYTPQRLCELISTKLWNMGYEDIDYRHLKFCFKGNAHQG